MREIQLESTKACSRCLAMRIPSICPPFLMENQIGKCNATILLIKNLRITSEEVLNPFGIRGCMLRPVHGLCSSPHAAKTRVSSKHGNHHVITNSSCPNPRTDFHFQIANARRMPPGCIKQSPHQGRRSPLRGFMTAKKLQTSPASLRRLCSMKAEHRTEAFPALKADTWLTC